MKRFLPLFFFLLSVELLAQKQSGLSSFDLLKNEIESLKNDTDLSHASIGISVVESKTGKILTELNSNLSLTPASTQKIITTAAALNLLGPYYTYKTSLEYDGTFDSIKGIVKGNLYIKGSGDPTLESEYFKDKNDSTPLVKKWADILRSKGIKTIEGSIIADASVFDEETVPANWVWGDIGNYYGAGASGLSYMDNMFRLYFNSGKAGDSTNITKIIPADMPNFTITNYVKAAGTEDNAYIYGAPYNDYRYVTGTIPPNKTDFEVRGSLPDPAYLLARHLAQALTATGIKINGLPTSVRQLKLAGRYRTLQRKFLYTYTSPTLEKIVYWTNMVSNNLFAEHILKTIALKKRGSGNENAGIEEVIKFWKSKGMDTKGMYLSDGCGLARSNALTARQLTNLLQIMSQNTAYNSFYNSLPVAGKSGTMKSMCKGTLAENNVRAKGGSFNRVRSFAGYATNKNGEQLCFSMIFNNYDCSSNDMRKKMEKLIVLIAELD